MSPTMVEKNLVHFAAVLCWWVNIKLGKSIFWCAIMTNFFVVFLLNILIFFAIEMNDSMLLEITSDTFLSPIIFYIFAGTKRDKYSLISNTQKSPNPNLYGLGLLKARTNLIVMVVLTPFFAYFGNLFYLAVIFAVAIGFYVLCVDKLPPPKKQQQSKSTLQNFVAER